MNNINAGHIKTASDKGNGQFDSAIQQRQSNAFRGTALGTARLINSAQTVLRVNPSMSHSQLRGIFAASGVNFEY